jgi:hypothetical protein
LLWPGRRSTASPHLHLRRHHGWQIETAYRELKVEQGLEGGLRSRTPEGIEYEVAGHALHYLLLRWLLADAAGRAGVPPLRLRFRQALGEVKGMAAAAVGASAGWVGRALRPRLLARLAGHAVAERPGRSYPRSVPGRRAAGRAITANFRRREKAKAKAGRQRPARLRPWFGDGWDLQGRQTDPTPAGQA